MTPQLRQSLDRILEYAVILSWADLLDDHTPGSIHVEYAFSPKGTINALKLWLSTARGRWHLVCGIETEFNSRIQFEDWCKSTDLASNLEFILRHQRSFSPPQNYGRAGLLQIENPTQEEIETAAVAMKAARSSVDSIATQPAIA